ncbi:thioredoxin domain-containing protein 12-like [Colletes gigas]|uniref:thioredoxin domain-containing protein 12-like n=1 Tax=Colletes gigas TaxID=935657 RepID=UPI001C9B4D0E|nr:thioredoxin domain-containing protein 12-like [Colletes gigas]
MQNLIRCFKYVSSFSLVDLASQVIGNDLIITECDGSFDRLFKWRRFQNGFKEAKACRKPILLFVHKPLCPACQTLKQKFSKSVRLMDLSDSFVMIQAEQEKCKHMDEQKFLPDGKYVPRILFFTPDGDFIEDAYNKHPNADKEHKYFYSNPSQIAESMLFVLREYIKGPLSVLFEHERWKSDNWDTDDDVLTPTVLS